MTFNIFACKVTYLFISFPPYFVKSKKKGTTVD